MRRGMMCLAALLVGLVTTAASAQYYFGRNKVQYNRFQWNILKTQHFDIYFYPEMETLAEIGASFAEESYRILQDRFNTVVLHRIPLIFYSSHFHFEETNTYPYLISPGLGGFFEFIKGRVVVPCDGSLPRFRHAIRHELVHVFERSLEERTFRERRSVTNQPPLWFTEGLAEYWSEGWSSEAETVIRDGLLNDVLVPLSQMDQILGTFLMYKEGQSFIRFLAETYGEQIIRRLILNLWKDESFSNVFRMTVGKELRKVGEEWFYHLKKTIFPVLESRDLPERVTRRITRGGYNAFSAFYREKGVPWVVFTANRDGYTSLYRVLLNGDDRTEPERLLRGEQTSDLESFNIQKSRIDVDSRGRLLFVAKSGSQDALFIFGIPERKIERRFVFPSLVSLFSPVWSPDGAWIALCGLDAAGRTDLYRIRVDDGTLFRITDDFYDDSDPDWSPDGHYLVFSSDRSGNGEAYTNLFLYEISTGRITRLTRSLANDRNPCWSPDGRFIAFASDPGGVFDLWVIRSDLGESEEFSPDSRFQKWDHPKKITSFATGGSHPVWTDSLSLIFNANEKFSNHLYELADVTVQTEKDDDVRPDSTIRNAGIWTIPRMSADRGVTRVKYKRRFTLDFAQSQIVQDPIFRTSGGGLLGISDMLGDEHFYFYIANTATTRSEFWDGFNVAVTRIDLSHRMNFSVGLYRLAGYYYNHVQEYFFEKRLGGYATVSYPFNVFERVETSVNIRTSEKSVFEDGTDRTALPVSNFFSYTKDNSLWGPTGPLDGTRFNITVGQTLDVQNSNINFSTVIADYRRYFRLGYRVSHAVRLCGQFNHGKEALPFVLGGSWDLRGYRLWSLWGTKTILISNELRFPFLDQFYLGFPFGGFGFSSIRGALFFDAGNVWDERLEDWKGSFGFGIRFRLAGYFVLRFDVGKKTDFKTIETGTFTQFFFGWDF